MNIVVLAGGISTERAVSIVSGTMVCKALRQKGHRAVLIDVYCGDERLELEGAGMETLFPETYDIDAQAAYMHTFDDQIADMKASGRAFFGANVLELCQKAEVVFMALHGEDGEGGKVQAVFDLFGIRYTGSGPLGSAVAMDKGLSRKLFAANGVPTATGTVVKRSENRLAAAENGVGLPCVVKPCCGGSSVGVEIAHTEEEYMHALEVAFSYEEEVVVEQYIEGREFSVGVVEGKAYPVIEIAPLVGFYDYKNKYSAGSAIETCPAEISAEKTAEMQKYAELAFAALKLECYARMDFMMAKDGTLYCLEANTLPGMTPTSLLPQEAGALGMDFETLCEHLIQVSLK